MSKTITHVPTRNSMRWTLQEDELLAVMAKNGATTGEIAKQLGRTRASVWNRKGKLGIDVRLGHTKAGSGVPISVRANTRKNALTTPKTEAIEAVEIPSIANVNNFEEAVRLHKEYGVKITLITLG